MAAMGKALYGAASRLPKPMLDWVQGRARKNSRTSRLIRRATRSARSGVHTIHEGPAKGLKIDIADSRPSYILGTAEPELQEFLISRLRPGGVFYDLGANVGYFSLVAARCVGDSGHVRAYEPFPQNATALRRSVEINQLSIVEIVEAAVSDRAGEASFATGPTGQDGQLGDGDLRVRTVAIDDEVSGGAPPPTVVKLDVEGAEASAIAGMRRTLAEHRPVVVCELHDEPYDLEQHPVAEALARLGYRLQWLEDVDEVEGSWAPHLVGLPG